jgi:methyl-accepting chemotaxis protein WspA
MLQAQNAAMNFLKMEIQGLKYEVPLRDLMENIPKFYIAARRFNRGDDAAKTELLTQQSIINAYFKSLISQNRSFQTRPPDTDQELQPGEMVHLKPEELEQKWQDLSRQSLEGRQQIADTLYNSLISDLQNLILNISDISNLTMDPEIDTYYIVASLMRRLPRIEGLISKIVILIEEISSKKTVDQTTKNALIEMTTNLTNSMEEATADLQKVFHYEKIFKSISESENKLKEPFKNFSQNVYEFINAIQRDILLAKNLPESTDSFNTLASKALQSSFSYWDIAGDDLQNLLQKRLNTMLNQQYISLLITALGALAALFIGYLVMRNISLPLTDLTKAAKNLASGNLSVRVPIKDNDEVGQVGFAFNQMAESFQNLIGQLQWTGIQLTTSTTEIAATAKQQETTIVEQEATTKEIATTAREISATAKDFAKTMNEVNIGAEQTSALASAGKAGLERMEAIMRQMVDAAGNISSKLAILNEKAGSITGIITTIAKVADQTNLLSLNAAIEAEKAGEYGRSFAVIAREIRRLADQTANATLDVEKMVNEMVSAVSAGVMGVDKFSEEINTGVRQVSEVGEQLSKIIEQVQQQTASFEAVNQGMQAQSLSAEQIKGSINQLSEAAQQTTESIRQFHTTIEQLNNAAQEMQNAVSKIKG